MSEPTEGAEQGARGLEISGQHCTRGGHDRWVLFQLQICRADLQRLRGAGGRGRANIDHVDRRKGNTPANAWRHVLIFKLLFGITEQGAENQRPPSRGVCCNPPPRVQENLAAHAACTGGVYNARCRVQGAGCQVQGVGSRESGVGHQVWRAGVGHEV